MFNWPLRPAWGRGFEAGMRFHWERTHCPYARDDLDGLKQIATLRAVNKKRRAGREKIAGLIHARSRQPAERRRQA
jgi:hypothetical protein